ncbi:MAG: ankyrin repeat domain-containing protein [Alphaproteobacteria bacterium]|nr:ankyrin repeat domain-containing protein [Alphaproteobacteria bacterium]
MPHNETKISAMQFMNHLKNAGFTDEATCLQLLEKVPDINALDDAHNPALIQAVKLDYTNLAQKLLERGVDPNAKGNKDDTALLRSAYHCNTDLVRALIDKGANVNDANIYGHTPLMVAVAQDIEESMEIISLLIENGADIHARDKYNKTALDMVSPERATQITLLEQESIKKKFRDTAESGTQRRRKIHRRRKKNGPDAKVT